MNVAIASTASGTIAAITHGRTASPLLIAASVEAPIAMSRAPTARENSRAAPLIPSRPTQTGAQSPGAVIRPTPMAILPIDMARAISRGFTRRKLTGATVGGVPGSKRRRENPKPREHRC